MRRKKMANADKNKLIKIYGVTLANEKYRVRPYGHGMDKIKIDNEEVFVEYVAYYIDDLISLIKKQDLGKKFLKGLEE